MARPKDTPERKALNRARRMVRILAGLRPELDPKWHDGMTRYWVGELIRLEDLLSARHTPATAEAWDTLRAHYPWMERLSGY